jgi:hypothetical protein
MKNLITIVFLVLSFNSFSQEVEIKSAELDKMVWDKINERLVSIGKKPIVEFEQGEMKSFSTRVCETLIPANAEFRHSPNDSISKYSGGECIYTNTKISTHENTYINYIENGNLEAIAQTIVDGWVGSESHRIAISKDWYDSTTVSTIIRYNKKTGYLKLAAAWHEEDDLWQNAFKN